MSGDIKLPTFGLPKGQSNIVLVTPHVAADWLRDGAFEEQRPLNEGTVRAYAEQMQAGRWRLSTLDIRTVGERDFVVNGRHRLSAVVLADVPILFNLVRVEYDEVESVGLDYGVFDRHRLRSHADGMLAMVRQRGVNLSRSQIARVSSAAPIVLAGFRSGLTKAAARPVHERADFVCEWAPAAAAAFDAIGEMRVARVRRLYSSTVFGVVLVTFRYAEATAGLFWSLIAQNDGPRKGDPIHTLVDFLTDRARVDRAAYTSRAVAACWNAAIEKRTLGQINVRSIAAPIRIAGTPYNGKRHLGAPAIGGAGAAS